MIVIQQVPSRSHSQNPARISRWNSSRHPYLFRFWRVDFPIALYSDNGSGKLVVWVDQSFTDAFAIVNGDQLYVADFDNKYNLTATVVDTNFSGPLLYIETDLDYNGSPASGGYFNLLARTGYYIQVEVLGTDPISSTQKVWGKVRISPDVTGFARFDAQAFLNGYVKKQNYYNYTDKNAIDPNVYGSFVLRYTGKWLNGEEAIVWTDTSIYWFVDNVKQLGEAYGQNLCDYLMFNAPALTERAKFLQDFTRPTYFDGYPFDLSVIIPDFVGTSVGMTAQEERFLQDGSTDGTDDEALLLFKVNSVQRVRIKGNHDPSIHSVIDFWLQANDVPEETYFLDGYIDDTYFETIGGSAVTPFRVTEKLPIKVRERCDGGIYLSWRNSRGGWSYWLFHKLERNDVSAKIGGTFGTEPDDLTDAMHRELTTEIRQQKKITIGDLVEKEDMSGLTGIESSPMVQVLISQSPLKWQTVKLAPKGFRWRSDSGSIQIELDILIPEYYTIPN